MQEDCSSFWNFSLAVYGNAAVQQECLDLQDRYGINVNLLLFCAFAGAAHAAVLSQADMRQAQHVVHEWHTEVVNGLRAVRRALKSFSHAPSPTGVDSFYSSVKAHELEAERLEQAMLERWATSHLHAWSRTQPSVAIEKNIATLFELCFAGSERPKLPHNLVAGALRYAAKLPQFLT